MDYTISLNNLIQQIEYTDRTLQNNVRLIINRHITAKAWLTGHYIVEYEQKGEDRARYGDRLIQVLAQRLGNKRFSVTTLKIYRQFYMAYPQLCTPIIHFLNNNLAIGQSQNDQLLMPDNENVIKSQSPTDQLKLSALKNSQSLVDSYEIFNKLSFTHLVSLLPLSNPLERAFYETMATNRLQLFCSYRMEQET